MATAPNWQEIGGGIPLFRLKKQRDYDELRKFAVMPGTPQAAAVDQLGSVDAVIRAIESYESQYKQYLADFYQADAQRAASSPTATDSYKESSAARAAEAKAVAESEPDRIAAIRQEEVDRRSQSVANIRTELENQYNNLVKFDSRLAYQGRSGDLPAVFNQQANQLTDAGVESIADLRIQDGRLINSKTNKAVTTSNLGGQVAVDRDTGVQKWGDIFSNVKGGANYGIQTAQDGSVILFPAWEKTKSPIAQIGLGGLESVITPLLTVGGALLAGPVGGSAVAGAAAGAAAGSSAGQLLASGSIDWEQVALSAAGAAAGQAIFGPGAEVTADLTGTTTGGMLGSDAGFAVAEGAGSAAGGAGAAGALDLPSYGLLDTTDFSRIGETGITGAPSTSGSVFDPFATAAPGVGEGIMVIPPSVAGGAATIPGLEAPGLSAMGGAQGITVPIQGGGVVSELGFVPAGATPSLGDPGSFINNPDYLGSPVISEDYLGLTSADMPSSLSLKDAFDAARLGSRLLGGQQQQPGLLGGGYAGGQQQRAGVDFSTLYGQTVVGLLPLAEQYRRSLL